MRQRALARARHAPLVVCCGECFVSKPEISTLGVLHSAILLEIGEKLKMLRTLQYNETPDSPGVRAVAGSSLAGKYGDTGPYPYAVFRM